MQYLIWLGDYHSWAQLREVGIPPKLVMQPCGRIEDATNFSSDKESVRDALKEYWPEYNDKPTTAYLVRVISPIK